MAKFYGSIVKTGKLGGSVFAVRNGVTIERQYQPVVANPKSMAQVAVRARMKLVSQLSAIMASVIAFRREGTVSPRNKFASKNFGITSYDAENSQAELALLDVDLTGGIVGAPALSATRATGSVTLALAEAATNFDRVVYCVIVEQADGTLRLHATKVVSEAGVDGTFSSGAINMSSSLKGFAYAYGVRLNTENARVRFSDIEAEEADAVVAVMRSLTENDYTLSETVAAAVQPYQG